MPHRTILVVLFACLLPICARSQEPLTFIGWSDQHVTVEGDAKHLLPAIDAMNTVEGTSWPEKIGGKVGKPAFVFGCGDMTEWPSAAARDAYHEAITKRLKLPSYDILGNHDEGGNTPRPTMKDWMLSRHGAVRYTFDTGGVHFVAVYSEYDESLNNPAQPVSPQALAFIREALARVKKGQSVIVALHLCFDAITNRDELVAAFGDANVILVLGGHYHKATLHQYKGFRFMQLPSPQSTTQFTVIRIEPHRLIAFPYEFKAKKWSEDEKVRLDVELRAEERK